MNLCATCQLAGHTCPRWAPGEPVELCVEYRPYSESARLEAIQHHAERYEAFEHWQCLVRLLLMAAKQ